MSTDYPSREPVIHEAEENMEVCFPIGDASQVTGLKRDSGDSLFVEEGTPEYKRQKPDSYDVRSFSQGPVSVSDITSPSDEAMTDPYSTQDSAIRTQSTKGTTPDPLSDTDCPTTNPTLAPTPKVIDGKVLPYDAFKSEGRPRLAVFCDEFSKAEKLVTHMCNDFINTYIELKTSGYENAEIDKLVFERLQDLRTPSSKYPSIRPVAFLGPAGAGKSSGLNCYLSQIGTAVESDSGTRGTSVVHEYSDARPEQTQQFLVVIRYLTRTAIARYILKQCKAIFAYMNLSSKNSGDLDEEEINIMRERSDTALDSLVTLLSHHDDFESRDDASEYFRDRRSEDEGKVGEEVVELIKNVLKNRGVTENNFEETYSADDTAQLNDIFQKISGPAGLGANIKGKPSVWPLLTKVEIHQDNDLLKTGLALGDAPGVTDTNETIVQNTRKYIGNSGTILVFATPSRCKQNPDLDANLCECIRLNKENQTYLIITNIDNKANIKGTDVANLPPEDADEIHRAEGRVEKLRQDLSQVTQAKETATDFEGLKSLMKRMQDLEVELKSAEAKVKQVSIEIRNRHLQHSLKNKFRELSGSKKSPDLKVIFTSNAEYHKHLVGYDLREPPILDVEATGIPAVRTMLYGVAAAGKYGTLAKMIRTRLPGVLNSIIGVLTKSPLERKQDVAASIATVLEEDLEIAKAAEKELRYKFAETVLKTFKENNAKWQDAADARLNEWSQLQAASFTAFCRHAGDFKPKNSHKANWTSEIRSILRSKANCAFNELDDAIDIIEKDATSGIQDLYHKLEVKLEDHDGFQAVEAKPFFHAIYRIRDAAIRDMANRFDDFKASIKTLRSNTTLDVTRDNPSFTTIAMREVYLAGVAAGLPSAPAMTIAPPVVSRGRNGKIKNRAGPHAARVHEFRKVFNGIGDATGIFVTIAKEMNHDFEARLEEWANLAEERLGGASRAVLHEFESRFDTTEIKSEGDEHHVQILKDATAKALDTIHFDLEKLLVAAEEYEQA